MEKPPQLSPKEIRILLIYFVGIIATGVLFMLLGLIRDGLPEPLAMPNKISLAVLAPLSGDQQGFGNSVIYMVGQAVEHRPESIDLAGYVIEIVGYDTGGTPDGAARAAERAAYNPNTVAAIGPLDARQAQAAWEILIRERIPVFLPASTTPMFDPGQGANLYRLPVSDAFQGGAMVEFMEAEGLQARVMLLVESERYQDEAHIFRDVGGEQVLVVAEAGPDELAAGDYVTSTLPGVVQETQPDLVIYLGSQGDGEELAAALVETGVNQPVIVNPRGRDAADEVLRHPKRLAVYLIAEPMAYVQHVLEDFNQAADGHLNMAGTLIVGAEGLPPDLLQLILDSRARGIIYLGGPENARLIVEGLNAAGMDLAFIGTDLLNDSAWLPAAPGSTRVYYTSPILNLGGLEEPETLQVYYDLLGDARLGPYAYELSKTVWYILGAASTRQGTMTLPEAVARNLPALRTDALDGQRSTWQNGQLTPGYMYVYQAAPASPVWALNPLVYLTQER